MPKMSYGSSHKGSHGGKKTVKVLTGSGKKGGGMKGY